MSWRLEHLSIGHRIAISVIAVLAVLFALALYGFLTGAWEDDDEHSGRGFMMAGAETRPELCMDSETRERVRSLMLVALDEALKTKVEELFAVWLRDSTGQPDRAAKGMGSALRAYSQARISAMQFNPPECSG